MRYIYLILWLAFGLYLYRLDFQSVWWDEGHSIFVASHPVAAIPTLPAMDVHPPAYFALLHLWMELAGRSEFALRFLSAGFGLLTVALIGRFARSIQCQWERDCSNGTTPIPKKWAHDIKKRPLHPSQSPLLGGKQTPPPSGGRLGGGLSSKETGRLGDHTCLLSPVSGLLISRTALIPPLLAALSPLYVAYAQEVRSYTMLTCLALGGTYLLWRIIFVRPRLALLAAYILLGAASLYTHYFTVFLLLFHNLAWGIWTLRRREKLTRLAWWIGSQAGILLLFLPQLRLAAGQITTYTNPNLNPPALPEFISRSWQAYTVGLTIDPTPARWGMGLVGLLFAVGLLRAIRRPRFLFLAGWFLLPLAAYFIVLQRQPSFEPRYMIHATPALFLLLGLALRERISLSGPAVLLAVAVFGFGLHSYYTNPAYFKDDSAGVADWLAAETTPDDIVYIDVPHPFHYYAEQNRIPAPTRYLFVDIHTAADILNRETAGRERLFWITWRGSDTDPRGVIPFLGQKYGRQLGQRDFRGYRAQWFRLPEGETTIRLPTDLPPVGAVFGDALRLDGAASGGEPSDGRRVAPGQTAWATLHFTLLRDTDVDYRVSIRARRLTDGFLAAQVDKDLLNDRHFRTAAWPLDDPALNQAINVYTLPVAPDAPPGRYRLEAVIYNALPPYPAEGVTGPASLEGGAAAIGFLTIQP